MTSNDHAALEKLEPLLTNLVRLDPTMTVGALLAFVSVAVGSDDKSGITPRDLRDKGFSPAAATRNLQYWGERLHTEIDPRDRRFRRITLTDQGKTLSDSISKALS